MNTLKQTVKQWLETGTVDIFLGYRLVDDHPIPHGFTVDNMAELDGLVQSDSRYSLEKLATKLSSRHPDSVIGMLARDCSQRALNVLAIWNQLSPDKVRTLAVNCCPSPLQAHAACSYLDPKKPGVNKIRFGLPLNSDIDEIETVGQKERLSRWMYEMQKCIKCYGCRNICPVCFCKECSLENTDLVHSGRLPPDVPVFHLVRATHMAGRCIDCGLCEEACPMDIPLRFLYRKVNSIVSKVFEYDTGSSSDQSPFSVLGDKVTLEPKPLEKA
jgi:ferredoxin